MSFIDVYITYPNMESAKKVVDHLLKKRLIACANLMPVESLYWWEGKIEETLEIVSVVKTQKKHWKMLKAEVERIHPYKVPSIMMLDAVANKKYEDWIRSETRPSR
jgi:periplasmic divalent cation tolerance protein